MINKISIVLPCFNHGAYLREAIESALNQEVARTKDGWKVDQEVIVVDDGSTDDSLEIARSYGAKIQVISQVNKGLAAARNTGVMNSYGTYVLFLDSDDILAPQCVQRISDVAEETDADIISPSFQAFGKSNGIVTLMKEPKLEDFKTGNRIGYCSAVKRSALNEVGGYSSKMIWGYEDLHLWVNLLSRGKKIITIPEVLWFYRTKEVSMITESIKHNEELMAQIYKDFPNFGDNKISNPLPQ